MEAVGAIGPGREAKSASRPANLVARMTAPLLAALAGRYDDTFVREGPVAPATPRRGLIKILAELPANIAAWLATAWASLFSLSGGGSTWLTISNTSLREFGEMLWNGTHKLLRAGKEQLDQLWAGMKTALAWAWERARAVGAWVARRASAFRAWIVAAVSKALSIFTRSKAEQEKREQEEAAYQKKLEARQAASRRDEARRDEQATQERAQQARRQAVADAAAVAALATDQVRAAPAGAERFQLVDSATLERRRHRKLLTGMLPA